MAGDRSIEIRWQDPMVLAQRAREMTGVEFIQAIASGELPKAPIQETMGFEIAEAEEGRIVVAALPGERHYNPIGVVHGGFAATVLDTALGACVHTTLANGEAYTTLETKFNLVRPITGDTGEVRCEGRIVHRGRRVATTEADIRDSDGKLLAHGTSTCMIFEAPG